MALENMTSIKGSIEKKKFQEKLKTQSKTSILGVSAGGGGMRSLLNPGSGQNEGEHTAPQPGKGFALPGMKGGHHPRIAPPSVPSKGKNRNTSAQGSDGSGQGGGGGRSSGKGGGGTTAGG
jgi:hypothetical protein